MAYVSNIFAMDTSIVETQGKAIAHKAMDNMGNAFTLVYAVMGDKDSMPTMFNSALTTFHDDLNTTLSKLLNQRYEIGQALQGAASDTQLADLTNASSFNWSQQISGWTPDPGTTVTVQS